MAKVYGIVLVGCGHIGAAHLADLYFRDDIRIIGVVDSNIERAKLFARKYCAASFGTDYKAFLKSPEVDIVIIATYVSSHLSILKDCLKANKNVLCEKPIAADLKAGLEFYRLVKNSAPKVLVGHILRYNATYRRAAELIQSGAIGKVKLIRMVQNHHAMNWDRYKKLLRDCSPIVDCGVHYVDVMQWFTGARVISVGGIGASIDRDTPAETYNYGLAVFRLSDGTAAYYEAGWSRSMSAQNIKEFIGEKGRIKIILKQDRLQNREEGDLIEVYHSAAGTYEQMNIQSVYKDTYSQLECLIGMIEGKNPAFPTMEDVISSFKVCIAADKALKNNCCYLLNEKSQEIIGEINNCIA